MADLMRKWRHVDAKDIDLCQKAGAVAFNNILAEELGAARQRYDERWRQPIRGRFRRAGVFV